MISLPGQNPQDIVLTVRKKWIAFLRSILLFSPAVIMPLIIMIVVRYYYLDFFGRAAVWFLLVNAIFLLFGLILLLNEFIRYHYRLFILTKSHIIYLNQEGLINRKIDNFSLKKIKDVSATEEGFLPTLLSFGKVILTLEDQTMVLDYIPKPVEVGEKILETRDRLIGLKEDLALKKEHLVTEFSTQVSGSQKTEEGILYKRGED